MCQCAGVIGFSKLINTINARNVGGGGFTFTKMCVCGIDPFLQKEMLNLGYQSARFRTNFILELTRMPAIDDMR